MKHVLLMAAIFLSVTGFSQNRKNDSRTRARENQEKIIENQAKALEGQAKALEGKAKTLENELRVRSTSRFTDTAQTVIVIEDGKVTINGKPASEFEGSHTIVLNGNSRVSAFAPGMHFEPGAITLEDFRIDRNVAFLGVSTRDNEKGAEILSVTAESGAEKAGLKTSDIITNVDNEKIGGAGDVSKAIRDKKPDDVVNITYLRDGREMKTKATLGKSPNMEPITIMGRGIRVPDVARSPGAPYAFSDELRSRTFRAGQPKYGMQLEDLADSDGVKVVNVEEGSFAEKGGLKENDLIVKINDKSIKNVDDLMSALSNGNDKTSNEFVVKRNGKETTLAMPVPKRLRSVNL